MSASVRGEVVSTNESGGAGRGLLENRAGSWSGTGFSYRWFRSVAAPKPQSMPAPSLALLVSPANPRKKRVDPRRLESLASAMRGRRDTLLESSKACKLLQIRLFPL
jgi:hypothetical protein